MGNGKRTWWRKSLLSWVFIQPEAKEVEAWGSLRLKIRHFSLVFTLPPCIPSYQGDPQFIWSSCQELGPYCSQAKVSFSLPSLSPKALPAVVIIRNDFTFELTAWQQQQRKASPAAVWESYRSRKEYLTTKSLLSLKWKQGEYSWILQILPHSKHFLKKTFASPHSQPWKTLAGNPSKTSTSQVK